MRKIVHIFGLLLATALLSAAAVAQTVVINEAYSRGTEGDLDWVEVYNPSSADIDISGFRIYDNGGQSGSKPKKLFPAGSVIPAKGFGYIVTDTASFEGDESDFGLSSGGDLVWLENADGLVIDSVVIPALGVDTSIARIPDGANVWVKWTPRTRGASNVMIKMNECYSRGVEGALDWIELYNAAPYDVDISGYKIYDNGGQSGSKPKKPFPSGTILPPNGFFVIVVDTASFEGDESDFGLSSGGDVVWLEDGDGIVIDSVVIPALGIDTSYQRIPDGSNVIEKRSPLTRGATNGTATSVGSAASVSDFVLRQNYPNPFNPATTISYTLAARSMVSLKVYNLLGMEIADLVCGVMEAGTHLARFDAGDHPSGIYFYSLKAGASVEMRKMALVK